MTKIVLMFLLISTILTLVLLNFAEFQLWDSIFIGVGASILSSLLPETRKRWKKK